MPQNYLSKTLHRLTGVGLLDSRRGHGGGFRLAVGEDLSVADVVGVFDHVRTHHPCLMGPDPCDPDEPCPAHQEWSRWLESRREAWEQTKIVDLLKPPRRNTH